MIKAFLLIGAILLLTSCAEEGFPISSEDSSLPTIVEHSDDQHINEIVDENPPNESNQTASSQQENPFNMDAEYRITPSNLSIPSIGVNADINPYGLDEEGAMAVPDNGNEVAWFEPGFEPGQVGNAVLAGHVDSEKAPAVFWDLKELQPGDEVIIQDDEGKELIFIVTKTEIYDRNESPIQQIFGASDKRKLNLITCSGFFDREIHNYVDRMVVYTELQTDELS